MGRSDDKCRKNKSRARVWIIVGLAVAAGPVISWLDSAGKSRPRAAAAVAPARTMSARGLSAQLSNAGPTYALLAAEESLASARESREPRLLGSPPSAPGAPRPPAPPTALTAPQAPAEGELARVGAEGFALTARSLAPHKSVEQAKRDAAEVAAAAINAELRARGHGDWGLDAQAVLDQFAVRDSLRSIPLSEAEQAEMQKFDLGSDRAWAAMRFEVRDDQLRDRRAQTRLWHAVLALAGFGVAFGGLAGYLKLDRVTKGHLSLALGIGTGFAVLALLFGLVSVG